jgi:hypothetical protein
LKSSNELVKLDGGNREHSVVSSESVPFFCLQKWGRQRLLELSVVEMGIRLRLGTPYLLRLATRRRLACANNGFPPAAFSEEDRAGRIRSTWHWYRGIALWTLLMSDES